MNDSGKVASVKNRRLEVRIGDRTEIERERLAEWRAMSPQQRWDAFQKLLELWWEGNEPRLRGPVKYFEGPRG